MTKFVVLFALVILVSGELITDIDGGKINAQAVRIETVPYQVSIRLEKFHHCTGSIISSKFVLTAGVCANFLPDKYKVQAGSAIENIGGSFHKVERIIRHSDYTNKDLPVNDIALFEVNPPFEFDETRAKIQLSEEEIPAGTLATAVGWGHSLKNGSSFSVKLQAVKVPIISRDECQKFYGNRSKITENQICAGFAGKEFLAGVSGGPLVVNGSQVGIVSWGVIAEDSKNPDVYTLVAKYKSWIRSYVPDI